MCSYNVSTCEMNKLFFECQQIIYAAHTYSRMRKTISHRSWGGVSPKLSLFRCENVCSLSHSKSWGLGEVFPPDAVVLKSTLLQKFINNSWMEYKRNQCLMSGFISDIDTVNFCVQFFRPKQPKMCKNGTLYRCLSTSASTSKCFRIQKR